MHYNNINYVLNVSELIYIMYIIIIIIQKLLLSHLKPTNLC